MATPSSEYPEVRRPAAEEKEWLEEFVRSGSEEAFAALVRRHVDLVYATALRRVGGDAHLAEDVVQQVFRALAAQASQLTARELLGPWLYTCARFAAAQIVRGERRRQRREREALDMYSDLDDNGTAAWERVRPVLDETIDELDERDRTAVVLRFFEGCTFAEIGARLRLTENAARMRVDRALDKLQSGLGRRGIGSTAAALGTVLAAHAGTTAPVGLAATVTSGVLGAGAVAISGTAATVASGFMSISKAQIGLVTLLGIGSGAALVSGHQEQARLRAELARVQAERPEGTLTAIAAERARVEALQAEVAELQWDRAALAEWRARPSVSREISGSAATLASAPAKKLPLAGEIYGIEQLEQKPAARFQARPEYPAQLRSSGVSGEAVVEFVVDVQGMVHQARSIRSTRSEFGESAAAAVAKWRFDPGQKGGVPVNTRMQVPIVFTRGGQPLKAEIWF